MPREPAEPTPIYTRHWFAFWATPTERWLERRAHAHSEELGDEHPTNRHFVVHRYKPEVVSRLLWIKKWRVGTLATMRTLDAAAGAIVHVSVDDLHDPSYTGTSDTVTALLVAFDFAENLERLRRSLAMAEIAAADLDRIADVLLVDLVNELVVAHAGSGELEPILPRAAALAEAKLVAAYDSIGGGALLRLAGRLLFFADSQVRWWEEVPPWRWTRRRARVRAHVARNVDRFLAHAFGEHNVATTRADALLIAEQLAEQHRALRDKLIVPKRRVWALEVARAPLAHDGLTSDTELLSTPSERVLAGRELDEHCEREATRAAERAELLAAAEQAHRELIA